WRAEASGVPDISINDCAKMLAGLGGSEACEQSRRVSISEMTALFVNEMRSFSSTDNEDADHQHPHHHSPQHAAGAQGAFKTKRASIDGVWKKVDATLTITSNDPKRNTWFGFKSKGALYLRGNGWDDMDIRGSVVAALELAEEQLGCETVYLCMEKSNPHLASLVRTLMYAGFEVVHPGVLAHADPKYLVLGMEL
ncbi:hypothetical protein BGZ98_005725, partial [Dissophora globulifera]